MTYTDIDYIKTNYFKKYNTNDIKITIIILIPWYSCVNIYKYFCYGVINKNLPSGLFLI